MIGKRNNFNNYVKFNWLHVLDNLKCNLVLFKIKMSLTVNIKERLL